MERGTTPLHTFNLPIDTNVIDRVRIVYAQNGTVVLKKENADCTLEGNLIKVKLTQEDTLNFNGAQPVEIQLRTVLTDGEAYKSQIVRVTVGRCLDNEVL